MQKQRVRYMAGVFAISRNLTDFLKYPALFSSLLSMYQCSGSNRATPGRVGLEKPRMSENEIQGGEFTGGIGQLRSHRRQAEERNWQARKHGKCWVEWKRTKVC